MVFRQIWLVRILVLVILLLFSYQGSSFPSSLNESASSVAKNASVVAGERLNVLHSGIMGKSQEPSVIRTFSVLSTGYSPGDGSGMHTATGTHVRWGVVAVDPRIIPLGSRIRLKIVNENKKFRFTNSINTISKTAIIPKNPSLIEEDQIDDLFPNIRISLEQKISSTIFIAEDTGGLIKGDRVDIWFPDIRVALEWGAKRIEVSILSAEHS